MEPKEKKKLYSKMTLFPASVLKLLNEDVVFRYETLLQTEGQEKAKELLKPFYDDKKIPNKLTDEQVNALVNVMEQSYNDYESQQAQVHDDPKKNVVMTLILSKSVFYHTSF